MFDPRMIYLNLSGQWDFTLCDLCGTKVKGRGNIGIHMRLHHSGELPTYTCEICDSKFRSEASYKYHYKHVHLNPNIKPWACMYCDFTCKRKNNIRQHLRVKHKMTREEAKDKVKTIDTFALKSLYPDLDLD